METLKEIIKWTNDNSGFLSVLTFIITILMVWLGGLWSLIRSKPKFKIEIIKSCSFGCIIDLNTIHNGYPVHKTAFAIYLRITNIGKAASEIGKIRLGYIKSDFTHRMLSKRNWIKEMISKDDFRVEFNGSNKVKILPFLRQRNQYYDNKNDTFLEVGKSVNGIAYFEQSDHMEAGCRGLIKI